MDDRPDPTKLTSAATPDQRPQREAEEVLKFASLAAASLVDDKCHDVQVLDVRGQSPITDFLVIASGTSDRQMRSALSSLEDLAKDMGSPVFRIGADDDALWLLADFVDVVVHLFEPNARAHYDLESMWPEAQTIDWRQMSGRAPE